jgi:hypothetical protein
MGQRYHGRNAVIELGAGSPLTVNCSFNTWTISFGRDLIDVSTFCDANRVQIPGLKNIEGSFDGFFVKEDIQTLWDLSDADTSSLIRITPTSLEPGVYFEGPGWISISSMGGSTTGAVTVTVGFSADGDWTAAFGFTSP